MSADAHRLSRRHFLGGALAAGAAGVLAGEGRVAGAGAASGAVPTRARGLGPGGALLRPDSLPHPHLPAGTDTLPRIEHIVVLMMENHSFDDHLGMLGRGDGLTLGPDARPVNYNPDPSGGYIRSFHNPNTSGYAGSGVNQSWNSSHISWDHATNMGFVKACNPSAMGYWTGEDLPFYHSMARTFPVGDRYFSSVMAQTYPNRRFLLAATALGNVATDASGITKDAPTARSSSGSTPTGSAGATTTPTCRARPSSCPCTSPIRTTADRPLRAVLHRRRLGNLPAFSLVDPYTNYSEESGDISIGEAYAATIVDAVLKSPAWDKTALIWTYDEHGGWYDHVPPVPAVPPDDVAPEITVPPDQPGGYDYTGFRVPAVVVSPWARRNHVSHVVYDHTSILKFVESKWNLPAMTYRDANANDLTDFFDFGAARPPFAEPPPLATAAQSVRRHAAAQLQHGVGLPPDRHGGTGERPPRCAPHPPARRDGGPAGRARPSTRPLRAAVRRWAGARPVARRTLPFMSGARDEITDLLYAYAERIDAGDFAGVAELFSEGEISFTGFSQVRRGRDEVLAMYEASTRRYADGTPRTKHVVSNVIVEVDDRAGSAAARSYFTVLQAVPGTLPLQPVIAGRYHDTFDRDAAGWRFTTRRMTVDLVGDLGAHMLFDLET